MTTIRTARPSAPHFVAPDEKQLRKLLVAVLRHYPDLGPRHADPTTEPEFWRGFRLSFHRLSFYAENRRGLAQTRDELLG